MKKLIELTSILILGLLILAGLYQLGSAMIYAPKTNQLIQQAQATSAQVEARKESSHEYLRRQGFFEEAK